MRMRGRGQRKPWTSHVGIVVDAWMSVEKKIDVLGYTDEAALLQQLPTRFSCISAWSTR
jgi:hypothetical protein